MNLSVLQSKSNATWTNGASSGSSSSDGAILNAGGGASNGGLTVDLLHADANSSGSQSSYLLSINGNEIGSSSQVNGACAINIPSLLSLSCVTATGGLGSSASEVVKTIVLPGANQIQGDVINATGSSSNGPSVNSGSGGQTGGGNGGNGGNGNGAAKGSGALAFTGLDVGGLVGLALALGLGGVWLVWWSRRARMSLV